MEKSNYFAKPYAGKNQTSSKSETISTIDSFYRPSRSTKHSLQSKKKENVTANKDDSNNTGSCSGNYSSLSKSNENEVNLDDSANFFKNFSTFGSQKVKKTCNIDQKIHNADSNRPEKSASQSPKKQSLLCFTEDYSNSNKNKTDLSCFEYRNPPCIPKSFKVDCKSPSKKDYKSTSKKDCKSPLKKGISKNENSNGNDTLQKSTELENIDDVSATKQCPLCFKFVEKPVSHMKSCASKKNVSIKTLLAALRLQEKQTAERQALGLPSAPNKVVARKTVNRKGPTDSNLELALALSISMQEQEENKLLQEAEVLMEAGLEEEAIQKRLTLERFGFSTSRPVKTGGRNKSSVTPILLKRTREDRERIITEKVSIILIGEDGKNIPTLEAFSNKEPIVRSKKLRRYLDKEMTLWKKSAVMANDQNEIYYVESLKEFISPSKTEISAGLRHLSQLPGRINTPGKNGEDSCDNVPSKFPTPTSDIIKTPVKTNCNFTKNILTVIKPGKTNDVIQKNFNKKLSEDWHLIVGKKQMSDITIYCKDEVEIPAHKLVLFVRCQSVLLDVIKQSDCNNITKEMIFWSDASHTVCQAFLEYIYCGFIRKILNLNSKELNELKFLAKKYNVIDLLDYIKSMHNNSIVSPFKTKGISRGLFNDNQEMNCTLVDESRTSLIEDKMTKYNTNIENINIFDMSTVVSESALCITGSNHDTDMEHNGNKSPDMFYESDNENEKVNEIYSRDDLDILISLIDKSERFNLDSKELNNCDISPENNQLVLDSEFNRNEKIHSELTQKCNLVVDSENNSSQSCNLISKRLFYESPKSTKSSWEEDVEGNSQRVEADTVRLNNSIKQSQNLRIDSIKFNDCSLNEKSLGITSPDFNETKKFTSSSTNFSGNLSDLERTTKCSIGKNLKLSDFVDLTEDIGCNVRSELKNSQSFITKSLMESKRKRSDDKIAEDLSNKKMCVDQNIPSSSRENNENDISDLTQSSENSSDKVIILSDESHDLIVNNEDIDPCRTSPGKKSNNSSLNLSQMENIERSVYIDSVWDGFDEMHFNDYDYTVPLNNPNSNDDNIEECESVACTTPNNFNISDSDTLSPTTFRNSKHLKEYISAENNNKISNGTILPVDFGSNLSLNLQSTPVKNQHLNVDLSPQFSNRTKYENSIFDLSKTPMKHPILDFSKLSPTLIPENIVITDSDSESPLVSCKPSCSYDKPLSRSVLNKTNVKSSRSSSPNLVLQYRESLSSIKQLLDDSFEINDNVFNENVKKSQPVKSSLKSTSSGTSVNKSCKTPSPEVIVSNKVTPLPDYSAMKTPSFKKELSKYGLKPSLGRKKGKLMLRYIYDQLHPLVPETPEKSGLTEFNKCVFKSPNKTIVVPRSPLKKPARRRIDGDGSCSESDDGQMSQSSSCSGSLSSCEILEESILVDTADFEVPDTLSQHKCKKLTSADIPPTVRDLIYSDPDLHQKILMYEPIFLEELVERLKVNGFKCKLSELMDYLDEQCITFRSLQGVKNRQKSQQRRESRKKKKNMASHILTSTTKLKQGRKKTFSAS